MKHYYWRVDLENIETGEIKQGTIIYASEFQAQMVIRCMLNVPQNIKPKVVKTHFDF